MELESDFSIINNSANKIYSCEMCHYKCSLKHHLKQHYLSNRHKKRLLISISNSNNDIIQDVNNYVKKYNCHCGNSYNDRSGLWKHKQKCDSSKNILITDKKDDITDKEMILILIKENNKLKNIINYNSMIIKQKSVILESSKNVI
jgi:hypothetical protein